MTGQDAKHPLAFLLAATAPERLPEHRLLTPVVHRRSELELAVTSGLEHRPSGEGARDVDDVVLGIAAIHAKGMELEQLPPVVLVEARSHRPGTDRRIRRRP